MASIKELQDYIKRQKDVIRKQNLQIEGMKRQLTNLHVGEEYKESWLHRTITGDGYLPLVLVGFIFLAGVLFGSLIGFTIWGM